MVDPATATCVPAAPPPRRPVVQPPPQRSMAADSAPLSAATEDSANANKNTNGDASTDSNDDQVAALRQVLAAGQAADLLRAHRGDVHSALRAALSRQ